MTFRIASGGFGLQKGSTHWFGCMRKGNSVVELDGTTVDNRRCGKREWLVKNE